MAKHPPKRLQATLWSVDISNLDIEKDKNYIIHQVLASDAYKKDLIDSIFIKKFLKNF